MRAIRILTAAMVILLTACAPKAIITNFTDPKIEESAVPAIRKAKAVIKRASSKLGEQRTALSEMDTDIDGAFKYAQLIRLYTQIDSDGIALSDGLDHSLGAIKAQQLFLVDTNNLLVDDIVESSDALNNAIALAALKDEESVKWQENSRKKDRAISQLNAHLVVEANIATDLRLKLEDAMVYKRILIAIGVLAFSFGIIKAALTVWSPFSKFRV
jgi:hypothetical protein